MLLVAVVLAVGLMFAPVGLRAQPPMQSPVNQEQVYDMTRRIDHLETELDLVRQQAQSVQVDNNNLRAGLLERVRALEVQLQVILQFIYLIIAAISAELLNRMYGLIRRRNGRNASSGSNQ